MSRTVTRSGEELANCLSHGVGLVCALAASPVLVAEAAVHGTRADVVGSSIFGITLVLLYLASTWYHAVPASPLKERLRVFDHVAIYLLIAGSYTPFALGVLRSTLGWTLFAVIWGIAAVGVVGKLVVRFQYPRLSAALYLAMGWIAVIAIRPLLLNMPLAGVLWLVAGGLFYTVGILFFAARRLPYAHFVWHLFVLAGSTCHYLAVIWYAV